MPVIINKSKAAFAEAKRYIPGGVNSPVRSFKSVGGTPPFIARAAGSKIYDIDGNEYIDYVGSWGPMILGHAHPEVTKELEEAVKRGTSYGAPTLLETELARLISEAVPSMRLVRMVNSGTEATMSALRLARGYTKRSKIVKFTGCYHGHHDSLLVKSGSGAMTLGVPDSPGVPDAVANSTITVAYNNASALAEVFEQHGREIAAVIIEPVPGNMGLIIPKPGYLEIVRAITEEYGSLLIFDEVMSGFRVAYGGAQAHYNINPDLTCVGKVIGGGLPAAAYGGRKNIMENVAPAGAVYQAGTLSGNPLAMTAGIATLSLLASDKNFYKSLAAKTRFLCDKLETKALECGLKLQFHQIGSMFSIFFSDKRVYDYESAKHSNIEAFGIFFHAMLEQGIYLAPSQFEAAFVSDAHSDEDIEATIQAGAKAFQKVAEHYRRQYH